MNSTRFPAKRLVLYSLWVVVPFAVLVVLTWNAWRTDAETRRARLLEDARQIAERTLEEIDVGMGKWSAFPRLDRIGEPPVPNDDPAAQTARARYADGDFEGVLGSPDSLRSEAGLPLRKLAALQLLRNESDAGRLKELCLVLGEALEFTSPVFLEAAEKRFAELGMQPPAVLRDWRGRWQQAETEAALSHDSAGGWKTHEGRTYLMVISGNTMRVSTEDDARKAVSAILSGSTPGLADGLAVAIRFHGKTLAGPAEASALLATSRNAWSADVVLADPSAFLRSDARTRHFMTGVLAVASLVVLTGLALAGRAYLRAIEFARRQSEFMAAVSHEIRTPLSAMGLLAENLESGVADRSGRRDEHARMIREECARLGGLVDNVLAFTREKQANNHEAFDVKAMVADAASLVRPMAERNGVAFAVSVADFPEEPQGNPAALRRALLNLLDNAFKHTPAGGNVSCDVRPIGEARWVIEVTDSGPGIPAHERSHIFEAFYRIGEELRRTTPGTGLGLALVKRTAEAHCGSVGVDDAPSGGSRFTINLPIQP